MQTTAFLNQQSWVIIIALLLFLCMCTSEENGVANEAIVVQWLVQTTSWDFKVVKSDGLVHCSVKNAAVLCKNYRERVAQSWTSPSEVGRRRRRRRREEERKKGNRNRNILAVWWYSGSVLSRCFLTPLGVFLSWKRLKRNSTLL